MPSPAPINLIGKLTSSETAKETPPLEVPSNLVTVSYTHLRAHET